MTTVIWIALTTTPTSQKGIRIDWHQFAILLYKEEVHSTALVAVCDIKELKQRLITALILKHYYPNRESILETDASDRVVSGILTQKQKDDL